MYFKERLKELRTENEMTQKHLAFNLGLSANSVCEWEKGRCEPGIEQLRRLSHIFDCSVDYLIGNSDDFGNITVSPTLSKKECELLLFFDSLEPVYQSQILEYARYLAQQYGPKKENQKKGDIL